jgi:hypothetical protein
MTSRPVGPKPPGTLQRARAAQRETLRCREALRPRVRLRPYDRRQDVRARVDRAADEDPRCVTPDQQASRPQVLDAE